MRNNLSAACLLLCDAVLLDVGLFFLCSWDWALMHKQTKQFVGRTQYIHVYRKNCKNELAHTRQSKTDSMLAIHIEQDNMQIQRTCWNLGSEALVKWLIKCFNVTVMPSIMFTFDRCYEQSHGMFVYSPHRSQFLCWCTASFTSYAETQTPV